MYILLLTKHSELVSWHYYFSSSADETEVIERLSHFSLVTQ